MRNTPCEPTPEDRRMVRAFAGFGVPQEDIARHLGLDSKTLRKHFRNELDRGIVDANAKVAQSLFQMATTGKNVAAAIFWMKCRGGWREKQVVEHSLAVISGTSHADELTDDQLARIAGRALDDQPDAAVPPARRSYVVNRPREEMTPDEWVARYRPARDGVA